MVRLGFGTPVSAKTIMSSPKKVNQIATGVEVQFRRSLEAYRTHFVIKYKISQEFTCPVPATARAPQRPSASTSSPPRAAGRGRARANANRAVSHGLPPRGGLQDAKQERAETGSIFWNKVKSDVDCQGIYLIEATPPYRLGKPVRRTPNGLASGLIRRRHASHGRFARVINGRA